MMKLRMRKGMAMLVALCMLIMMIPVGVFATSTFAPTDIIGHWAQPEIQSWIDGGLVVGYPDGTFKPGQNVTRAEFMTLVNGAFGYTEVATINYTDVQSGSWYYSAVAKAEAAGYIDGYGDGTMKPGNPITREEAAKIISVVNALTTDVTAISNYSDKTFISGWAEGYVGAVTTAGIMQGYPDGSFMPKGNITRAESVFGLDKALDYIAPALAVDSVSAITTTGVDVVLPTVTEAVEGFTIEVKNPAGTIVPVTAINLEVGDAAVTFEFVTPLTSVTVGNWTVGGVTFDTGAQAAVQAVNTAITQIQLLNALQSSYFTGAKSGSIVTYQTLLTGLASEEKSSVALIQKNVIDAGNTAGTEAVAVKAVTDATNQVELYAALQNSYFNRVNADFIAEYDTLLDSGDTTVALVQAAIDSVNMTKADAAVDTAELGLSRTVLNSASVLVNNLKDDVAPATDKKLLVDRLALQSAVIAVNEANTNAKLTAALNNLAKLSTALDLDTVNSALLTNYRAVIAAAGVADKITATKIQMIVTGANNAAEATAVTNLANVTGTTTVAQFKDLASKLDVLSANFDSTKVLDAKILGAGGYIAVIVAAKAANVANVDTAAELEAIIVGVNLPLQAVTALKSVIDGTETADTLLAALKATTLTLTNVLDANKAQYLADVADIDAATNATDATTAIASVSALKKVIAISNSVVELNAATTASAAKDILSSFALATVNENFINLSTTVKLEVAELVLAAKATAGAPFATSASVTAVIASQISAQADLLVDVNAATTIVTMNAALAGIKYSAYDNLSAVKQLDVAESFLLAFPKATLTPFARINYTTITAIRADVDKAIVATN